MALYGKKTNSGLYGGVAQTEDLGTTSGLYNFSQKAGGEVATQANKIMDTGPRKLSVLERLSKGLGAFNPAEALLTGQEKGMSAGIGKYVSGVATGLASGVTGRDYEGERRTFSDVAQNLGIENKYAKFGIGLIGDVLLDPSTYFGGAIAKGLVKGTGKVTETALKGIGKLAPETEVGLRMAGEGVKDALGNAVVAGYKASPKLVQDTMRLFNRLGKKQEEKLLSNFGRWGTDIFTPEQQKEIALSVLIPAKKAEFTAREIATNIQENLLKEELKSSSKVISGLEKNIDKRIKLSDISGIGKVGSARLENAGLTLTKIITEPGEFVSKNGVDEFIPITERIASVLGKTTEQAQKIVDDLFYKLEKNTVNNRELSSVLAQHKSNYNLLSKSKQAPIIPEGIGEGEILLRANQLEPGLRSKFLKAWDEQKLVNKETSMLAGLENPYEAYFPFLKKDKVTNFVKEIQKSGVRVGSEDYIKQFKNLLTNENIETDVAKSFFTREAQVATDVEMRKFLQGAVDEFGKPLTEFKNAEEALNAGYTLLKEKGKFGKELGYISKWDKKFFDDMFSPEFKSIDILAKATGFDALTSLFKRSVTGLFPSFHVRNYVSGMIQNFEVLGMDALNPKNISVGMKIAKYAGEQSPKIPKELEPIIKPFLERFGGSSQYAADLDYAVKNGLNVSDFIKGKPQKFATLAKEQGVVSAISSKTLGQTAPQFRVARAVGNFIETQQKATAYMTAINKGASIEDALSLAERAGFDYRMLTRFESQIMRRLIPFYSFSRKNIELQLRTAGENPERINQVLKTLENVGGMFGAEKVSEEDRKNLPDYIKESISLKLKPTSAGMERFISNLGTPIEQFAQQLGSSPVLRMISQTNPLIKASVELGIGKDSFRKKDIKDVYNAQEYSIAPAPLKKFLQIQEVKKPILKKVNGKYVKTGERTEYVANPERLLILRSMFTARGFTYFSTIFDKDLNSLDKVLKSGTGIKPQNIDLETVKAIEDTKRKRELEDLLKRYGEVYQTTKTIEQK